MTQNNGIMIKDKKEQVEKDKIETKILKYFGAIVIYSLAVSLMNQSIWKSIIIAIFILVGFKIQESVK